jgi:predicted transcriptional regulator
MEEHQNYEAYLTREMLQKPITELSRLIADKWFLSLQTLSERTGVPVSVIEHALEGGKIRADNERKLRSYLESYKGEGDLITKRKLEQAIAEQFGISVEEYRRIMGGD